MFLLLSPPRVAVTARGRLEDAVGLVVALFAPCFRSYCRRLSCILRILRILRSSGHEKGAPRECERFGESEKEGGGKRLDEDVG